MTDAIDLEGEETRTDQPRKSNRLVWFVLPPVLALGGLIIWLGWPDSEPIVELPEEREDIQAAIAPPIVPQSDEPGIDVPAASDTTVPEDPALVGPSYIPPATDDTPSFTESLPSPVIDPFQTSPDEERRSRLQDALNASPVIEVEEIVTVDEVEESTASGESEDVLERRHTLIPGAVIPAALLQGINTDLPGIAVAQVSRDVYDSISGTRLLIPRGSRIFGRYGSELVVSDERVLVTWERIDLPNGDAIKLGEVIGADPSGNAGLKDQVHRGTGKALTVTGLTSLITASLAYAADVSDPTVLRPTGDGGLVQEPSIAREATQEVSRQYGDIVAQVAQRHLDRGTTLTIRPGYEFVIQIAEEINLNPYSP